MIIGKHGRRLTRATLLGDDNAGVLIPKATRHWLLTTDHHSTCGGAAEVSGILLTGSVPYRRHLRDVLCGSGSAAGDTRLLPVVLGHHLKYAKMA
jgi:hypothetical protein